MSRIRGRQGLEPRDRPCCALLTSGTDGRETPWLESPLIIG